MPTAIAAELMNPLVVDDETLHHPRQAMAKPSTFGAALTSAREATGMSQTSIASHFDTYPNTVYRWERRRTMPSMEVRMELLKLLEDAPRPLLEALARESGVDLASIGMGLPPPARPAAPPAAAAPLPPAPAAIPATAQSMVDDALREAAEEVEVSPKVLRPALSRMLDRLARGGVPIDAAARMVLGVPKKTTTASVK